MSPLYPHHRSDSQKPLREMNELMLTTCRFGAICNLQWERTQLEKYGAHSDKVSEPPWSALIGCERGMGMVSRREEPQFNSNNLNVRQSST